jgi:N-acetyl-anhydromuramyl-L-alanine amidase AmpD
MSYLFIPANSNHTGGRQSGFTRIVLHATVSPCVRGGARNVARYFQDPAAGGAAHYVVDPGEVVQCVQTNRVAYHAPPNQNSVGIELCDPQTGSPARWADPDHRAMLQHAAQLVHELTEEGAVPVTYVDATALRAGRGGITEHNDVSLAFHQSSHTDPGSGFPISHFLDMVRALAVPPGHTQPSPIPSPAAQEARMIVQFENELAVWEVVGSRLVHITKQAWQARGLKLAQVVHLPQSHPLNALPKDVAA